MNKSYIRKRKADSIIICIELVSYIPDSKAVQVSLSFVEDFNSLNCSCKQLHFSILSGIYWFYLVHIGPCTNDEVNPNCSSDKYPICSHAK